MLKTYQRRLSTCAFAMTLRFASRRRLLIASAVIGLVTWQFWPRSRVWPAELIGVWVASPNEDATYPLELREDGRAREIDIWCGGHYTQSHDWSLDGDRIRLESPPPTMQITSVSQLTFTAGYYWSWLKTGEKPGTRRRIFERHGDTMRFQPFMGETQLFRKLTSAEVVARPWLK